MLRLLSLRFGALPDEVQARIRGAAGIEELDRIGERLLTAGTLLDEALEAR